MVKKLFKHEILFYCRILWPIGIALLGVAFCGRILQQFENDNIVYSVSFTLWIGLFILVIGASLLLTTAVGIVRFYKNLFTSEGYLTLTLPITPIQHIFVKLSVSSLAFLANLVVAVLAVFLFLEADVVGEIVNAVNYLFGIWGKMCGVHLVVYIIEVILLLVATIVGNYLVYYTCMAIGQLFRKYRIAISIGIYFGYYMISQFFGGILSMIQAVLSVDETMQKFIEENLLTLLHLAFGTSLVLTVVFGVICFVVTHLIIRNKLNLE